MRDRVDPHRRRWLALALAVGVAPSFVRHARAADEARFSLGVASGQPLPTSVVLWTRLTGSALPDDVPVRWTLAEDEAFARIAAQGEERALAADAHSVHAEPAGLRPGRWYWYRFEAMGQRSAVGRTRTAPAPDAAGETLRFAIASCQRYDHGHYAAWRHASQEPLDLVLFLGDYIYEYGALPGRVRPHEGGTVRTLAEYRARYAQYKADPALQAAHAAAPWIVVWDDHEVENDYAALHSERAAFGFAAQRAAAYQAWWEHQPVPKAMRPVGPDARIHQRFDWGRLARIHALDDRQYRDAQACPRTGLGGSSTVRLRDCPELLDPRRTLLGAAQERWLADGWDAQRGWNLLAQQTLMARCTGGGRGPDALHWTDGWDGYPEARRRLLQGAADHGVRNLVVLGGDVHANIVADLRPDFDDETAPIVGSEFCGTSISSRGRSQAAIDAVLALHPHLHHGRGDERGYVHFTLDDRALVARLRVVDDVERADSGIRTSATFTVESGRPGAQRA